MLFVVVEIVDPISNKDKQKGVQTPNRASMYHLVLLLRNLEPSDNDNDNTTRVHAVHNEICDDQ